MADGVERVGEVKPEDHQLLAPLACVVDKRLKEIDRPLDIPLPAGALLLWLQDSIFLKGSTEAIVQDDGKDLRGCGEEADQTSVSLGAPRETSAP